MNHLDQLRSKVTGYLILCFVVAIVASGAAFWVAIEILDMDTLTAALAGVICALIVGLPLASLMSRLAMEPLSYVWQAVLHVSPDHTGTTAPNIEEAHIGRELVTSLVLQVYQLASQTSQGGGDENRSDTTQAANIVSRMPLPLFVLNKEQLVTTASDEGLTYCGIDSADLFGKPLYESVNLEFPSDRTLDKWIEECQNNKVTDTAYWERVRIRTPDGAKTLGQCDMAVHYNRDNPSGTEFIVTMFDRTERYAEDDETMSFVALAVHELRTPLTMLRGYIEVFEDELSGKLDPELQDFMNKMRVSAGQLSAFVNNILNVARVDENQLSLHLSEGDWPDVLERTLDDMDLKAKVHGKTIERHITQDLPTVAIDRVSIYEVVSNLVDNAIKYSGDSKRIVVSSSIGKDGSIETTVKDYGVGIPESAMSNLFEKFYRSHRTKTQIGGSGLGLYLCKAIVRAHGGQVWASSKEGKGSTFGFSLQPYAQLADELKKGNNKGIVRNAHGWIKNHSLYRR